MKHIISIFLLFVIGLAACRELKTKKPDISHVEDAKLTNDIASKTAVVGSDVANNANVMTGRKLRHLIKRSGSSSDSSSSSSSDSDSDSSSGSSSRSRSRHGHDGSRSRYGHDGSRSRYGHDGSRSRYGEGRSRNEGGSYESYYGNRRYGHGQGGSRQGGHVPYHGSGFPYYGSRHIGGRRHDSRPVITNSITSNENPKIKDCDCPFSQHNEPAVESQEYDLEFLRQWQRAFSSHPCCRERWEAYSLNSK